MAITFVGVGAMTFGTAQITPVLPGSLATDDILIAVFRSQNGQAVTIPTPNGGTWTEVADSPQDNATDGVRLTVFWSRYNGTQGNPTTNDPGVICIGVILAYRDVIDTGDPWDVTAGNTQTSTTAGSIPGDTTTVDGCMIVAISACDRDANSTTNASGWTNASLVSVNERVDEIITTGIGGGFAIADGIDTTAGTVNATTWTQAAAGGLANLMIALKPATGVQTLSGALFTKAPTFNTGAITSTRALTGALFTKAPTFFTGSIAYALNGVLFTKAPTFFTGVVTPGAVALTGTTFVKAPTFFAGSVTLQDQFLDGVLFQKAPTFFQGSIAQALNGVLFSKSPTFFTGSITSAFTLSGVLFTKAPTFPQGAVTTLTQLTGVLFTKAPTFPTGVITPGAVALTGTLFTKAPSFFAGVVQQQGGPQLLGGTTFVKAPTFPTGIVTPGAVSISGVLFQKAPTFFVGNMGVVLAGTTFQKAPTFFVGELIPDQLVEGVLFQKAPTFFVGTLGVAGSLTGVLFVKAPTFFQGSIAQGGASFWQPDPAGYTVNPAAYVAIGRSDTPPWPLELVGHRFRKAPVFYEGAVT